MEIRTTYEHKVKCRTNKTLWSPTKNRMKKYGLCPKIGETYNVTSILVTNDKYIKDGKNRTFYTLEGFPEDCRYDKKLFVELSPTELRSYTRYFTIQLYDPKTFEPIPNRESDNGTSN